MAVLALSLLLQRKVEKFVKGISDVEIFLILRGLNLCINQYKCLKYKYVIDIWGFRVFFAFRFLRGKKMH